ncbi:glycosyltransferase family 4 protein [Dyadobacter luticola]|uniref:Glycosyltransferase family 4 protein n=1 Tax=Dyadobacter luticola TaxID=1979387 RepID=A0A5R9KYC7_9BACT|nr:glycosyltransferase family 4 protein [Dyadobacter luticola]TLV01274.1 glycosyltransferase family 4 protein [Dyadobacter luticola]
MKVLWFTNHPSLYKTDSHSYNGYGWISSLENLMSGQPEVELAISFMETESAKIKKGNVSYYPITLKRSIPLKLRHAFDREAYDAAWIAEYMKVIEDFKPDIIHVFGTEKSFGLICGQTTIPTVIHIQGILNPYLNSMFAPGTTALDYFRYSGIFEGAKRMWELRTFTYNARREARILQNCRFFMGRTNWDREVVRLYSPGSKYFYCSEILRSPFYVAQEWAKKANEKVMLITTISHTDYKGYDFLLKTAKLLKELKVIEFEWKVYGIHRFEFWEKKLGIRPEDVNVKMMGVGSAEKLIEELQESDIFIHPSYIDNSPNSICEAQLLGMPVISTHVGGISSLIEHGHTGMLIPANDTHMLSYTIQYLSRSSELSRRLGQNARQVAMNRHDTGAIVEQNLAVYRALSLQ